ncbi:MAG: transcriptional repressor [Spirochaetales bacterium]|nr:transcriptional repressor [Spirochaetales bacterium]
MGNPVEEKREIIAGELKKRGLRMTLPRRVIIETLADADSYLTAEDIYHKFHAEHPGIGLATVYRTLVLFHQLGIVTKLDVGEGKARFELARTEHHHLLVCEKCYKVVKYSDFTTQEKDGFAELERLVEKMYHFRINRHVVQYCGVCPECLAKEGAS